MHTFARFLRVLFSFIILAAVIVFAVSNRNSIAVNLYPLPFVVEAPVFLVMFCMVVAGVVLASLITLPASVSRRRHLKRARLREQALENEIAALRAERQFAAA